VIVLGNSRFPYAAAASEKLRIRLEQSGAAVFYTLDHGAATIRLNPDRCTIESMEGKSLVLDLDRTSSSQRASDPSSGIPGSNGGGMP
jgi:hypothetical protein